MAQQGKRGKKAHKDCPTMQRYRAIDRRSVNKKRHIATAARRKAAAAAKHARRGTLGYKARRIKRDVDKRARQE